MLEISLSKQPARICRSYLLKRARLNQQASSKTATLGARADSRLSRCRRNEEAAAAIDQFNGKEIDGRALKVNEAKPRENRGGGGGRWTLAAATAVVAAAIGW